MVLKRILCTCRQWGCKNFPIFPSSWAPALTLAPIRATWWNFHYLIFHLLLSQCCRMRLTWRPLRAMRYSRTERMRGSNWQDTQVLYSSQRWECSSFFVGNLILKFMTKRVSAYINCCAWKLAMSHQLKTLLHLILFYISHYFPYIFFIFFFLLYVVGLMISIMDLIWKQSY